MYRYSISEELVPLNSIAIQQNCLLNSIEVEESNGGKKQCILHGYPYRVGLMSHTMKVFTKNDLRYSKMMHHCTQFRSKYARILF